MNQEEINKNNILLAEFVGFKKGILGEYTNPFDKPSKDGYVPIYLPDGSDMKFNSDWNWLMMVVEKIESLPEVDYTMLYVEHNNIYQFKINLKSDSDESTFDIKTENKIESIYGCAVRFIEWYNEQKNISND